MIKDIESARSGGYVPLYRRLYDDPEFRSWQEASLFVYLLATAAWKDSRVRYKGALIELKTGQLAVSTRDLSRRTRISHSTVRRIVDALVSVNKLAHHVTQGVTVISICNYAEYQLQQSIPDTATDKQPAQQRHSGDTPVAHQWHTEQEEEESKKGKKDKKGEETFPRSVACNSGSAPATKDAVAEQFDQWWKQVPRKVDKGHAEKAFRKALREGAEFQCLLRGIMRYAAERDRLDKPEYTAHPTTWLNGKRWLDEVPGGAVLDRDGTATAHRSAYRPRAWDIAEELINEHQSSRSH